MKCDVFYKMQALVVSQGRSRVDFSTRDPSLLHDLHFIKNITFHCENPPIVIK